ncbi:MAG TPA: hypothetical protein VLZ05_05440 [Mycobacterium sp.]|nr:hypothetical protein [Mycobacterium sp.]
MSVADDSDPLLGELAEVPRAPDRLLELLARVPDPRQRRGIRHGLTGVLAVALRRWSRGHSRSWRSPNGPLMPLRRCWCGSVSPGVPTLSGRIFLVLVAAQHR